jgi:hypothetical protein
MVQNPGKTLCLNPVKPVNLPEPVSVVESASGGPAALRMAHSNPAAQAFPPVKKTAQGQVITSIDDRWRIDDDWWRSEPISRLYYTIRLASGNRQVIYKDLTNGQWYKQTYK